MFRRAHLVILSLAICALAWAQVFGLTRGYVCDHQDSVVETTAEHCHGVETPGKVAFTPCESGKDCCQEEGKERHTPLGVELEASPPPLPITASPAFVAILVAEILPYEWPLIQSLVQNELMNAPPDTGCESPPTALQVARCMVILV